MNSQQQEEIANKIHEQLHKEKGLTYYDVLGILEVVKAYYVTRICQLNGAAQITVHKVKP